MRSSGRDRKPLPFGPGPHHQLLGLAARPGKYYKTFAEQVDTGDQACCAHDKEHNQIIQ
jgi:hypothetical protein